MPWGWRLVRANAAAAARLHGRRAGHTPGGRDTSTSTLVHRYALLPRCHAPWRDAATHLVTPAFDQPRPPALPLQIVCHLLGSGNQLHPAGLHQPALTLSHRTPT